MLIEQQIAERQERAAAAPLKILKRPTGGPYGDYTVKSASGRTYRVAIRGLGLFENYCSCPDFAINTLGTCKHVEAMLLRLRKRHQKTLEATKFKRTRASISLQYGNAIEVRLRMPASPSPTLLSLSAEHFGANGLLRREHYRRFAEIDQKRILCCIQNMRMLCNSTFLFDKQTHHSPKLQEFREIMTDFVMGEERKVVVLSEFERMTHLAGEELRKLGIGFVSLHGGVPSRKRGALIERFRNDPACKVFLSTDAGGVGLNLQAASVVVNFEPPWNPARLEQRIGRVHRLGQSRPVHVIHMLTSKSIEERVWETLALKKSLFAGVFDSLTAEISFAKLGRKTILQAVKEIFAEQPGRPKPVIDHAPAEPVALKQAQQDVQTQSAGLAGATVPVPAGIHPSPSATLGGNGVELAAASFIEAGLRLIESITAGGTAGRSTAAPAPRLAQVLPTLFTRDARTNRPALSIPLPDSVTQERLTSALSALLNVLGNP